jgi:hypothetical protein
MNEVGHKDEVAQKNEVAQKPYSMKEALSSFALCPATRSTRTTS